MGLLERAAALNRCSARAARASGILVKIKMLKADPPEASAYMGADPNPDDAFPPSIAQIAGYLAKAEALIAEAQTALNDGKA